MDDAVRRCVHLLIMWVIASTPFWSLAILRQGVVVIPALLALQWAVMGGCIMQRNNESDVLPLARLVWPNITSKIIHDWVVFGTVLIPTVMAYRALCQIRKPRSPPSASSAPPRRAGRR